MTLAEAQAERASVLTAINNITAGGVASYDVRGAGGGRSLTKLNLSTLYQRLNQLDALIARMQSGTFTVVQFRDPE